MVYSASRPYHIPTSTTGSQYAVTNGYSSLPYNKWIQSTPESDFYAGPKGDSTTNPLSQQYQLLQRDNYLNHSFSDISKAQYFRSREEQPVYATVSSKRPIINYLVP
ncbi:unnamed protein product [Rotaria socialis]|uniref:Uncharacterized protein n=1 Tax=Rotaria socialis TaxID=392032 RepID=A0A817Q285_9BILA|nr:unnamed protein product [Rotaria socialis]CAF3330837.1 unnamed protein product [Rotaria socialis]CAF3367034.1 unnamed protein product [Rotaria socialis]CAF3491738.1 unnamed protein product [Rotaria socialis]CAF3772408.1 unnamed protein product [Rotaria socialis]